MKRSCQHAPVTLSTRRFLRHLLQRCTCYALDAAATLQRHAPPPPRRALANAQDHTQDEPTGDYKELLDRVALLEERLRLTNIPRSDGRRERRKIFVRTVHGRGGRFHRQSTATEERRAVPLELREERLCAALRVLLPAPRGGSDAVASVSTAAAGLVPPGGSVRPGRCPANAELFSSGAAHRCEFRERRRSTSY